MSRAAWARVALVGLAALAPGGASAEEGLIVAAHAGYFDLSGAPNTARAVFGSRGGATFGGELGWGFCSGFFVTAGAGAFSKDGERVFVAEPGGPVFPLGHPLSLRLVSYRATLGYRLDRHRPFGLFTPYVGLGGGVTSYRERSTVGGVAETLSRSKASLHALAGAELGRGSLRFAMEIGYSVVPDTIGIGGVSQVYGEKNVGGFSLLGKLAFYGRPWEK